MTRFLSTLLPPCEASTRTMVSGFGASGLLHVLAGAALVTWFGAMPPRLFPPPQGVNSIRLTASSVIQVEPVDNEPAHSPSVTITSATAASDAEPVGEPVRRETSSEVDRQAQPFTLADAWSPSPVATDSNRRTETEIMPDVADVSSVLPRIEGAEPPLPMHTSVASIASQQDAGQLDAVPAQIYSPQPEYPADALRMRLEGRVVLRVQIDASGHVAAANVLRTSGHPALDDAAQRAVSQWRFDPPLRLGVAVATEVAVPVLFKIQDE